MLVALGIQGNRTSEDSLITKAILERKKKEGDQHAYGTKKKIRNLSFSFETFFSNLALKECSHWPDESLYLYNVLNSTLCAVATLLFLTQFRIFINFFNILFIFCSF